MESDSGGMHAPEHHKSISSLSIVLSEENTVVRGIYRLLCILSPVDQKKKRYETADVIYLIIIIIGGRGGRKFFP